MHTYGDLVELARICFKQAREAENASVSAELRHIAKGYQVRAAIMDHGRLPDIGEEPQRSAVRHFWSQSADRVGAPAPKITLQGL
jgi:hypothetical protein